MYTVKHAATLTGVPEATLRAWERRYGVVTPERSPGGYRLYDEGALRRLSAMNALVGSGWSPPQAATQVIRRDARGVAPPAVFPAELGDPNVLVQVAADFDGPGLEAILDEAFAMSSFERVIDGWLMPAMQELGSAWRDGRLSIAAEHFVSATVQRRLAVAFDAAGHAAGAPRLVVGLARGSRHELGVLAFATALRRVGLDVLYVGGDLPADSWVDTVARHRPAAVVLGVPTAEDVPAVRETIAALEAAHPEVSLHLGGGHQDAVGGRPTLLGHSVGGAASALADSLRLAS